MSGEWEVVVKGGKQKQKSQMTAKEWRKATENNLSNNKYNVPIELTDDTDKSTSPEIAKITGKSKKKQLLKEVNVNQHINKLNGAEIKKAYMEIIEKFPNQHTSVLMDLALHINLMLNIPSAQGKNHCEQQDFPYAFLSNDAIAAIRGIFGIMNNEQICGFLKSAVIQMLDDNDKDIQSIGLRMLVQVCLRLKPTILIYNRKNLFDLLNMYREQTVKFKLIVWTLRQACVSFHISCQIWLIYLLPFITQKCHTESVVSFGEDMKNFQSLDSTPSNDIGTLLITDFIPFIDLIFNDDSSDNLTANVGKKTAKKKTHNFQLSQNHVDRLKLIYPKIKELAFLSKSPSSLKDYFASLFVRLSGNQKRKLLNDELLSCLDYCLKVCPESLNQLNHLYRDYTQQTRIFLDHLTTGKSEAYSSLRHSKVYKSVLDSVNRPATATSCPVQCKNKNKKSDNDESNSGSICWTSMKLLLYVILMSTLGVVFISYQYPQQYVQIQRQVRPHTDYVWDRIVTAYRYCEPYAVRAYQYCHPTAVRVADSLIELVMRFSAAIEPYIKEWVQQFKALLEVVYAKVEEVAPHVLDTIGSIVDTMYEYVMVISNRVVVYIKSPEFQRMMLIVHEYLQELLRYVQSGLNFCVSKAREIIG